MERSVLASILLSELADNMDRLPLQLLLHGEVGVNVAPDGGGANLHVGHRHRTEIEAESSQREILVLALLTESGLSEGFRLGAPPRQKRRCFGMVARETGLWDFALKLYGTPGVSEACLVLQEESGVDVPVLLFAAWMAGRGRALTSAELGRVDERIREWRTDVVQPLRTVRRRLKSGPYPAPSDETERLRNSIKAAELQSEKIELAVLEAEGNGLSAESEGDGDANQNLWRVIHHYRGSPPDENGAQALAVVEAGLQTLS